MMECEVAAFSRREPHYDAFLFASLCDPSR
jgi:hypothetical protein